MTRGADRPEFLQRPGLGMVLAALPRARLVGGCVRDSLVGVAVADIDLATPDTPEAMTEALVAAGLRVIPTGIAHGTVTALAQGDSYEITTLRRDVQTDGRHAVVAYTDDWRLDAGRRDFTINAMSMTADGTVFDYFGGIADLRQGRVRFVGAAGLRIAEDYLRILRYFRFLARYGAGAPDAAATAAIAAGVGGLHRLSGERVWSELRRILLAPKPQAALELMHRLGVLPAILPTILPWAHSAGVDHLPPDPLLRLAALVPHGPVDLKLSREEAARLLALQGPAPSEPIDDASLRRALADTPVDILVGRAALAGRSEALRARLLAMPVPVFALQGRDLQALGMPPGPAIGETLRRLRESWLASGCTLSRDDLLAQLAGTSPP